MAGAFVVAKSFLVKEIWENGEDLAEIAQHQDLYRWYLEYFRSVQRAKTVFTGTVRKFGRVTIQILSPARAKAFTDWNSNSLVMLITFGDFRLLLAGDANFIAEAELVRSDAELRATVLKVGHHGADDASGVEFLTRVRPELAVISVNRDNLRGYPGAETLKRLADVGARVLRTDRNGTIRLFGFHDGRYQLNGLQ
jgi:competence protein ComEC